MLTAAQRAARIAGAVAATAPACSRPSPAATLAAIAAGRLPVPRLPTHAVPVPGGWRVPEPSATRIPEGLLHRSNPSAESVVAGRPAANFAVVTAKTADLSRYAAEPAMPRRTARFWPTATLAAAAIAQHTAQQAARLRALALALRLLGVPVPRPAPRASAWDQLAPDYRAPNVTRDAVRVALNLSRASRTAWGHL